MLMRRGLQRKRICLNVFEWGAAAILRRCFLPRNILTNGEDLDNDLSFTKMVFLFLWPQIALAAVEGGLR